MRFKLVALAAATSMLGLAGCGGGGSTSAGSARGSRAAGANIPGPVRIYRVALTGSAEPHRGALSGTGDAIIAFHSDNKVCWRFAHLHGFSAATSARIYKAPPGQAGKVAVSLSTGPRLHHEGCVHVSPAVINAIEGKPQEYYVNIHSAQYPSGAVRAQL